MARTVHSPKPPRPVTPDGRLGHVPFRFSHTSATLGWHGLRVEHDPQVPARELVHPPLECLFLALQLDKVPERVDHRCDDARYEGSGLPHSVTLVPPRVESRWRWQGVFESNQFQLSPALVGKVAQEAFDLDPARLHFSARYYDRSSPEVIDTLKALRNELLTGGPGGRLCAESLANVLVVHLIRRMANGPSAKEFARKRGGRLARPALRAVQEYIDAHLDQNVAWPTSPPSPT
jgi:AraC family transcriptional regulator